MVNEGAQPLREGRTIRTVLRFPGPIARCPRVSARVAAALVLVIGAVTEPLVAQGARPEPLVVGETFTISSGVLRERRRINVYLPSSYGESDSVRLPVLYMPDGGVKEDFVHVAGLVQVLTGNGGMRPFILVGIENTERRRDMTPPTDDAEDRKIAPRVGGSAAFRGFLRKELMPEIRRRYRTTDETAIVGESLAGLFIVDTFLREPDLFDTLIAFDPSLWWNAGKVTADAAEQLRARPPKGATLYLASSSDGTVQQAVEALAAAAERAGARVHHEHLAAESHATIYHPAALRAFRTVLKPRRE
jgi:predicted alpha/beta superfamily hydrolase